MNLILITACLLLSADSLHAQKVQRFDSLYTNETGTVGKATYNYYVENDQVIKTGDFRFSADIRDHSCPTHLTKEFWSGAYKKNERDQEWTYNIQEYAVSISSISSSNMEYDIFLNESVFKVNYNEGKLDDRFSYERNLYKNDKKEKTLEKLTLSFSDHKVNGEVFYERDDQDGTMTISGSAFKGLMEGEWIFEDRNTSSVEKRNYKKGILTSLLQLSKDDTILFLEFPISDEILSVLNQEETEFELANKPLSLTFSDGYPRNCVYVGSQKRNNESLEALQDLIFKFEPTKRLEFGLIMGTNRGYYPLTNQEKEFLKTWPETEFNYRKVLQQTNDLIVANMRYRDDSLMQVLSAWAKRQEMLLEYIQPWNQILFKDQLEFYNRQGLVMDYTRTLIASDTLKVDDKTHVLDYDLENEQTINFLTYLVLNFNSRSEMADSLMEALDKRLGKLYLVEEVGFINGEIITAKEQADSIYAVHEFDEVLQPFVSNIGDYFLNSYFDHQYEHFTDEASVSTQKEIGTALLNHLTLLRDIDEEFKAIQQRSLLLDSLYTEYSFDPFTYSDKVPVRVKKRLYELVINDMMIKILKRIEPRHNDPAEILNELNLISALQKRLIFLRDKDTRKIERKLRSNKSLKDRLEILRIY